MLDNGIDFLRNVLLDKNQENGPYKWHDLMSDMGEIACTEPTKEHIEILIDILRFDGRIDFSSKWELPHSLSPEDMLKSMAIQIIGKMELYEYIPEIEKLESTTDSSSLASIARAIIKKLKESKPI